MNFKEWLTISERTLYHGTIVDNEPSIRKYGLQGGWHGPLGSFVAQHYDSEEYGEPSEEDEVVFAADRDSLGKAVNAMVHHIGQKLKKDFHDVSDNDIRNYGLLVMIKDSDLKPYSADDRSWAYSNPPRGAEEGDYFDSSMGGDVYLRGPVLIRFLKRNGQWPRNWGVDSGGRSDALRGRLGAMAISRGQDKEKALSTVSGASMDAVRGQLRRWESVDVDLDVKLKGLFSKRKRNWRKMLNDEPIPRLARIYDLLAGYSREERDYYLVMGIRNFVLSVVVGCMVQRLYGDEVGIFGRYDLLGMVSRLPLVNDMQEALAVARQMYDPNDGIRIAMSSLWTTDLMRSIND